jgi:hypothetical protein
MEGNNKQNDSSSFVYELFGPKETHSSSSSGVLGSMSSQSPNVIFFLLLFISSCF